ncbi:glycoside hydrolase family 18 protein [Sphaerobolus stellatus SS14]|uniref:Glycoside hydrolase family 18 protein n=1 Tax=Sphaerobolus stellatus (strain SS14) TaxID=990650 RepID=A0A0C9T7H1_SPHS4|nr:glycoside hydrolase family 18 protein [Sphaerobolus stellatus SS14]
MYACGWFRDTIRRYDLPNNSYLKQLIERAHSKSIPISLTVGGYDNFSGNLLSIVASSQTRSASFSTLSDLVLTHCLDGLNFNWQSLNLPNNGPRNPDTGQPLPMSQQDSNNFLTFLKELRANPSTSKIILSVTSAIQTWDDAMGSPLQNVTGFAEILDFIEIMNIDVWPDIQVVGMLEDIFEPIGPNSPLDDSCAEPQFRKGSAVSAVKTWTAARIPTDKIVLGVTSYSHTYNFTNPTFIPFDNATVDLSSLSPSLCELHWS